jgi:hypothetical protein
MAHNLADLLAFPDEELIRLSDEVPPLLRGLALTGIAKYSTGERTCETLHLSPRGLPMARSIPVDERGPAAPADRVAARVRAKRPVAVRPMRGLKTCGPAGVKRHGSRGTSVKKSGRS